MMADLRILKPHALKPPVDLVQQFKPWTLTVWSDGEAYGFDLKPNEVIEIRTDPVTKSVSVYIKEVDRDSSTG